MAQAHSAVWFAITEDEISVLWTTAAPRCCKAQRLCRVSGQPPATAGGGLGLMALHRTDAEALGL